MNLKINSVNFNNSKIQSSSSISMTGRYTGIPNFHPRYVQNPKQSFFTKTVKFIRALYYANFKKP